MVGVLGIVERDRAVGERRVEDGEQPSVLDQRVAEVHAGLIGDLIPHDPHGRGTPDL